MNMKQVFTAEPTDAECREEMEKLLYFFNTEGYGAFGYNGDVRGWTPAETAINAMRSLLAMGNGR